jgi:hypothetical protein
VFVVDEYSPEGVVVETCQVGIDAALMWFAHGLNLIPLSGTNRD